MGDAGDLTSLGTQDVEVQVYRIRGANLVG